MLGIPRPFVLGGQPGNFFFLGGGGGGGGYLQCHFSRAEGGGGGKF